MYNIKFSSNRFTAVTSGNMKNFRNPIKKTLNLTLWLSTRIGFIFLFWPLVPTYCRCRGLL